jgi:hypothetical protein
MKTRPSQQKLTNIFPRNNFERSNATSHMMQVFLITNIYFIFIWVVFWSRVNREFKGKIFKQNF